MRKIILSILMYVFLNIGAIKIFYTIIYALARLILSLFSKDDGNFVCRGIIISALFLLAAYICAIINDRILKEKP